MMRTLWWTGVALAAGLGLGNAGCTTAADHGLRARTSAPTFALAVTVNGGSQPSSEQWNVLRTTFTEMLGKRGYQLVENSTHASNVIHVNFLTPPGSPLAGKAVVLSIEQLPPPLSTGYPGIGSYGPHRISLASFDSVLAADHSIYLTPKDEPDVSSPIVNPSAARL